MNNFKAYFRFNSSERKGILSLLFLILLVIIAKWALPFFETQISKPDPKIEALIAYADELDQDSIQNLYHQSYQKKRREPEINFYKFNPNNFSKENWQSFGLSEKQAQSIQNYLIKGGVFRTKRDLKKMYVVSDEFYASVEDFIDLPDTIYAAPTKPRKYKKIKLQRVFINKSDSASFEELYGIGPVLAQRIIRYRDALGGFHSKAQLNEVYGVKDTLLQRLDSLLVLDSIQLTKLNINAASADELRRHPYIDWKVANSIVKLREQHGAYASLDELAKSELIKQDLLKKLKPYFKLNQND